MAVLFGAVADDDTGATDLAGMLADQGVRAVLVIDLPSPAQLAAWAQECNAVVLGLGTRALTPAAAYSRMREGVRLLQTLRPEVVQVKYCSTFDSTAEGNIGPSIDAALDELGEDFTIALPALPVNGRTTYMGYHFVGEQLLSDSPMRHHPLTPMTHPNLVAHLQTQTRRKVGLASYPEVCAGAARLRERFDRLRGSGIGIAITDCTNDADLATICEAANGLRLLTGSSAFGSILPRIWKREGCWNPSGQAAFLSRTSGGRGFLVVSGSCSPATRRQNQTLAARGALVTDCDGVRLAGGEIDPAPMIASIAGELARGRVCLLRTAAEREDVERVHAWAQARGLTATEAGCRISQSLATMVREIVRRSPPEGLIVAGGETSSVMCRALDFGALRVGANIDPGVPLCLSLGGTALPVVLKSGNFGGPDFYQRAMAAIHELGS